MHTDKGGALSHVERIKTAHTQTGAMREKESARKKTRGEEERKTNLVTTNIEKNRRRRRKENNIQVR